MRCGLIGERLSHSYSKEVHELLSDYEYGLYPIAPDELENTVKNGGFDGLNVTIPYKKDVIPFLDGISPEAEKIGSVNTIVFKDGRRLGYNTDYYGFSFMAERAGISFENRKILILGSGGTSLTAAAVCKDCLAREVIVISRRGTDNYENIDRHFDAEVIINTTPIGMYPDNEAEPLVKLDKFPFLKGVIDCIYNPLKSRLLLEAENRGIAAAGGLVMLVAQAKKACEYFTGKDIDDCKITEIYENIRRKTANIALIGMAGAGKSTIGRIIAEKTGRKFIDTDTEIEMKTGMTIPEIFGKFGEERFRREEEEIILKFAREKGAVIACGGGVIKSERNIKNLKMNSVCVFIKRNADLLALSGRPLSKDLETAKKLYAERLPLYNSLADFTAENLGTAENTALNIIGELHL